METSPLIPDTNLYPHPHAITPALWAVGRGGWTGLPIGLSDLDCNVYLLCGDVFDVLIDCGGGSSLVKLMRNIRRAGSDPTRVSEIWLTHSHYDHFLRAGYWTRRYPDTLCRISHLSLHYLQQKNYRLVGSFHPPRPKGFRVPPRLLPLREGDRLHCPPWELGVEELPGHVPDQLGFRGTIDGLHVLFSGDAALGDQGEIKGMIGWIDGYWLSHLPTYRETLARLVQNPPDLLLPGHGQPHYGSSARQSLDHCLQRVENLLASADVAHMGPYL